MAQEVGALYYDLDINDKKLNAALNQADGKVRKFGDRLSAAWGKSVQSSQMALGAITAIGAGLAVFGAKSVQAYNAATEATTKLRTNLLNVKGATEAHVKSLESLASQLQSVGVIEDDVIKAGMSQLATFNLQGKTIEKLTPKITDMVAQLKGHNATSEDMVGINNLVGKVMTGNVGALARYGVTLSENQKQLLANGNETERAAVLVKVLSQNYGEVNKALRNTPQGAVTALKNAFGDLQEGVGYFISYAMLPLVDKFNGWISTVEKAGGFLDYFKLKISENQQAFAAMAGAITAMVIPALINLGIAIMTNPIWLIAALGAAIGVAIFKLIQHFGGWKASVEVLKQAWQSLQPSIQLFGALLRDVVGPEVAKMKRLISEQLVPALSRLWQENKNWLIPALKAVATIIALTVIGALKHLMQIINSAIKVVTALANWFSWSKDKIIGAITGIKNFISGLPDWVRTAARAAGNALLDMIPGVNLVKGALERLNPWHRESPSLVDNIRSGAKTMSKEYANLFRSINAMSLSTRAAMGSPVSPAMSGSNTNNYNNTTSIGQVVVNSPQDDYYLMGVMNRNAQLSSMKMAQQ